MSKVLTARQQLESTPLGRVQLAFATKSNFALLRAQCAYRGKEPKTRTGKTFEEAQARAFDQERQAK